MKEKQKGRMSASFATGAIALAFLIVGYQTALFVQKAAVLRITANMDVPDTVYVTDAVPVDRNVGADSDPDSDLCAIGKRSDGQTGRSAAIAADSRSGSTARAYRKNAAHSHVAEKVRVLAALRRYEEFPFDPNTVSAEDMCRLGFSEKQAQSIVNYRLKGGRFARKSDFARSYVVSDSIFARLEPYIDIPLVDINLADSAAFDALPGIGPYFAAKMVTHRAALGGYSYKEQLMDIWRLDEDKYAAFEDLITVGTSYRLPLWTMSEADLAAHPYFNRRMAHSIVIYRQTHTAEELTVDGLQRAGIIDQSLASKLSRCLASE